MADPQKAGGGSQVEVLVTWRLRGHLLLAPANCSQAGRQPGVAPNSSLLKETESKCVCVLPVILKDWQSTPPLSLPVSLSLSSLSHCPSASPLPPSIPLCFSFK